MPRSCVFSMEVEETIKKRKLRSWVWDNFDEINNEHARCKICQEELIFTKGTNSMSYHLNKKHQLQNPEFNEKKPKTQTFSGTDHANKLL